VEPRLIQSLSARISASIVTNRAQAEALERSAQAIFPSAHFPPIAAPVVPPQPAPLSPPTVTGIEPVTAAPGTVTVTFHGTNLGGASAVVSDTAGISGSISNATATAVTASIAIATGAKPGLTSLGVVVNGKTVSQSFTVLPAATAVAQPPVVPVPAPAAAERPCTKQLANAAGASRSPRARCADSVGGGAGPELVVISAGGALFAMMRDEVTYGDWALYCAATGCAKPTSPSKFPVTSVPIAQAEQYADWLSKQTGVRYRLPTNAEWTAAVGSNVDTNSVNCAFGGRGSSVREVGLGANNEFGLRDVLGNAREWVRGPGGAVLARGGSFGQPMEECMKDPSEPHSGAPDGRTGFRLVREVN
jgi:hypothetical protein